MTLRSQDFESCASTNSAIPAEETTSISALEYREDVSRVKMCYPFEE